MTNDEAIGVLEDVRDAICENIPGNRPELDELREAVQMAVNSLHERKKGKWICSDDMYESGVCSVCEWDIGEPYVDCKKWFKYCPICGARMSE